MEFKRGQKSKLDALTPSKSIRVGISIGNPRGHEIDISCFGLDAQGKLSDDRYFVFYNQPASPCGSIKMETGGGFDKVFDIDLSRVPSTIQKLVFTATLDGNGNMSDLSGSELVVQAGGSTAMRFPFDGSLFAAEKAVMIGEIYMKSVWRIAATGQGFNGGLAALLEHFGGEVADDPAPTPPPAAPPKPADPPPKVNLGKVTLEKRGSSQKVSLKKGGSGGEVSVIHVNLNWDQKKKKGWLGLGGGGSADLDLGCFWEMLDGSKGVIQPLGNRFGSRHAPPFILLDQDDRSGASAQGENMRIYRPDLMRRLVVFAMIYEGSQNFTQVNGRVTVKDGTGTEIVVHCDAPDPRRTFCSVVLMENDGRELKITKEERYYMGHPDCDQYYGFGFRWVAGSK